MCSSGLRRVNRDFQPCDAVKYNKINVESEASIYLFTLPLSISYDVTEAIRCTEIFGLLVLKIPFQTCAEQLQPRLQIDSKEQPVRYQKNDIYAWNNVLHELIVEY